ncbi:hypothetical protein CMV_021981 [Castanea mollissima]|uniref:Uncharacterized protein n=1 Tax=Castanea mollissima TaxID=60419 RepID=A0A8J4QSC3_9ROSI|nr:hypothetical protein CMV_021981 [Castanea mollissima]
MSRGSRSNGGRGFSSGSGFGYGFHGCCARNNDTLDVEANELEDLHRRSHEPEALGDQQPLGFVKLIGAAAEAAAKEGKPLGKFRLFLWYPLIRCILFFLLWTPYDERHEIRQMFVPPNPHLCDRFSNRILELVSRVGEDYEGKDYFEYLRAHYCGLNKEYDLSYLKCLGESASSLGARPALESRPEPQAAPLEEQQLRSRSVSCVSGWKWITILGRGRGFSSGSGFGYGFRGRRARNSVQETATHWTWRQMNLKIFIAVLTNLRVSTIVVVGSLNPLGFVKLTGGAAEAAAKKGKPLAYDERHETRQMFVPPNPHLCDRFSNRILELVSRLGEDYEGKDYHEYLRAHYCGLNKAIDENMRTKQQDLARNSNYGLLDMHDLMFAII